MPKGVPNKKYAGEFKQQVIEEMRNGGMVASEIARKYEISHSVILRWERIYLEEGATGLYVERRGRATGAGKGRPLKLDSQVEKDLISEVQRLRAENAYLKNLQALVLKDEQHQHKKHW